MSRISRCLSLILTVSAGLPAQPVLASEPQHRTPAAAAAVHRAAAIKQEVASSPAYGAFGGYVDAAAAAAYAGPNGRRYFNATPPVRRAEFERMVEAQASANGVPASLVHRVIMRESRYNPRAVSAGNYGLMQIRLGTARAMGYSGSAAGLLDAETNMTYAVKYLAGAYRAAGGNEARAIALYASGYNARPVRKASFVTAAPTVSPPTAGPRAATRVKHVRHHPV